MSGRVSAALLICLIALTCAHPAGALNRKAVKANDRGLAAAKAGDWAGARAAFEEALSIDDGEGRIRTGVKYTEYFPSLGLAEAAIELGDPAAASAALDRFDAIEKPGSTASARAQSLRARLGGGVTAAPPDAPAAPAPEAVAARRALEEGDLAGARRLARSAPTDSRAQEVLAAVDALLADKLTAARRDQEAGALRAARAKLEDVLEADPGNSAAQSLLDSVRADAGSAGDLLADARAAHSAGRFDDAEDLARKARGRDSSLSEDARALEAEISKSRRSAGTASTPSRPPATRSADGRSLLSSARKDLDAGRLAQARRQAGDALAADAGMKAEVEAVRSEISRRGAQADDALRRSRAAVSGGRFAEARQLAAQASSLDQGMSGDVAGIRSAADEGEAKAQRLVLKIEAHLESGAAANARTAVARLAAAFPEHPELAGLRAGVEGSGELVSGMKAYFRGDWAASIDALSPLVDANSGRSDLLTVLGCAHATRGLLAGADDEAGQADLARARELFRRALAAKPDLELDARYFSPRLRALFEEAREG
jgi:tetratricopeptide (TPR) repeat protein